MIFKFDEKYPDLASTCYIAPDASVIGDVEIGQESSVWFGAVLRGDINSIRIGERTNIQDRAVLHVDRDAACEIGDGVTIGHSAVVHGSVIENGCLIGIGAVVLSRCRISEGSIVGAGAVVPEGAVIPPRSLVLGIPGKVVRTLESGENPGPRIAESYVDLAAKYRERGISTPS